MTTSLSPAPTAATPQRPARSAGATMLTLAGGAMVAGSLLYVAGLATSPPQASPADADYIASLAADEGQTALSALLLHYGNMALALAWLAAPALVRGRRGRIPTIVGALLSAIGLVTVTGMVLYDFWTGGIGQELPADTALALVESVQGQAAVGVVGTVTLLGLLGPLVGLAGLARAGVITWWLLVPAVACLVASAALSFTPLLYAGFALVGAVPTVAVGLRMIARTRAEAAA
ncbi:hypothetical protein [Geodermatophilus nigrescens]|uniref:DUF4386 family protein n=1 Tax=Geodermatophilus nigrescens TaxID=1070870 RepID=A0A1M5DBI6_9ACTN|nr:hypothetical protein [Geodermatophilus nigrescens]SHF64317.1 hypothetical protein SAMN05444351_0309 [Geodermatophilus nigrescens]